MDEKFETHLFQYQHNGATWTLEIEASSEKDARERLNKLLHANYLGILQMKLPLELGIFARFICWLNNRRAA